MDKAIFRAYDVRGVYPSQINEKIVEEISRALAAFFKKGRLVVGRDARLSSPALYRAVIEELKTKNQKLKTVEIGLTTTPMFYFLVNKLEAAGGVMVTASHNPKEWNGLKTVGRKAKPISGNELFKIVRKLS